MISLTPSLRIHVCLGSVGEAMGSVLYLQQMALMVMTRPPRNHAVRGWCHVKGGNADEAMGSVLYVQQIALVRISRPPRIHAVDGWCLAMSGRRKGNGVHPASQVGTSSRAQVTQDFRPAHLAENSVSNGPHEKGTSMRPCPWAVA
jgi:hypothetical protein